MSEVVVVGGGLIGSLIAYRLGQAGLEVTLLEAGKAGQATRASAGMLAPHAEGLSGELLEWAREGLEGYPELARELEAASGIEVPVVLSGVWSGVRSPLRGWEALRGLEPHPGGYLDPVRLLAAVQKAFVSLGGTICREEALHLEPGWVYTAAQYTDTARPERGSSAWCTGATRPAPRQGAAWGSSTRRIAARQIVIASGAWSGRFGLEVRPLKGEALLLAAPPPSGPVFAGAGYALPRGAQVYLGATQRKGWPPGVEAEGLRWLQHYRDTHFPHLRGAAVLERRWGYRPAGPLTVGQLEPGILAATGHGRNGILLAPATARRIRELVLKSWKTRR
ncbi:MULTISPECIES: FAD-dependent oxidoreductase [unclassified Meiothermus]|uniref:FAD-dependent oxidoreductase n=1 Tax=unclassified Meiothermus TaxID=370471 RepID=UPI000D7C4671|nr:MULTISPECIES: FAD-dependent oxidoreductase [unclassified Meiothermus]PZA08134.1 FAD-dependent oxidoreductase [Meiothermus sp. Pnk-1]RYM31376.1 FAD-dependent oxidoreductase [Meiothermus sp. PNK-Is4]